MEIQFAFSRISLENKERKSAPISGDMRNARPPLASSVIYTMIISPFAGSTFGTIFSRRSAVIQVVGDPAFHDLAPSA